MLAAFAAAWRAGDSGPVLATRFGLSLKRVYTLRCQLGLPPRYRIGRPGEPAAEVRPAQAPARAWETIAPVATPAGTARETDCRFVVSGPPWVYCDQPTERGRSMCEAHRRVCIARAAA
jgi:hypothetical protein